MPQYPSPRGVAAKFPYRGHLPQYPLGKAARYCGKRKGSTAHRSTPHTDLPRGAVLSAEIRHHKLNEAPRELQAIEDDDTAADNIDDAQGLICEFGAEQGNNCRNT